MTSFKQGDEIATTLGPMAGYREEPLNAANLAFDSEVRKGAVGEYVGMYTEQPTQKTHPDWHVGKFEVDGAPLWVPLHVSHFEPVTEGDELHAPLVDDYYSGGCLNGHKGCDGRCHD